MNVTSGRNEASIAGSTAGRFVERPAGLLRSQARQPLLQSCLARWLNLGENNAHPGVRLEADHFAECGEACAAMGNSQGNFRAFREWT